MKQIVLLGVASLLLVSCRHSRQIARPVFTVGDSSQVTAVTDSAAAEAAAIKGTLLEGVRKNSVQYTTFSAKLKIDFENDKQRQQNISTNIRMQKDSVIWISVSAPIIGEVARAIITPDSLKAYDKFNKRLYLRALNDARDLLNIPFEFSTLQDMIIGNPVFLTDSVFQVVKTPAIISFSCDSTLYTSLFNVFADDYLLQQSKVMDKNPASNRSCELTYGEYKVMDGRRFATTRRIFVEEKNITRIAMDFNRVEFNQPLSFPFTVPASGYTLE
ncbi:DUF4292 domain-containing protein [uncultured Chitinophaga sp.]|jgi:hypothetical protein|uniref:DUF4292 domain-containing protein n=1 Tax=uncultured Chitinophaga sp. TaxID=339340 RepID=UPI0026079CB0|nr:DUF4292 domain-containing protein [uncultured Chitinophaga sp.]